jgi:hypothetical protein
VVKNGQEFCEYVLTPVQIEKIYLVQVVLELRGRVQSLSEQATEVFLNVDYMTSLNKFQLDPHSLIGESKPKSVIEREMSQIKGLESHWFNTFLPPFCILSAFVKL